MGTTCAFVLFASSDPSILAWLGTPEYVESVGAGGDAWCSAIFDEGAFWSRDETLSRIVQATGRPALIALTLDSDFLGVVGQSPDGSTWNGVIDREAAGDYRQEGLDEGYDHVVPDFAPVDQAARGARAWAEGAGLTPNLTALEMLFDDPEWEKPIDQCWPDILVALGVAS